MTPVIPHHLLQVGESGEIVDVLGDASLVTRLAERGVRRGGRLEVLSAGPPFLWRIGDSRLSWRDDGQVEILVRTFPGAGEAI